MRRAIFFDITIYMKNKKIIAAPSILSSDFSRIREELQLIQSSGAEWVHLDVMDGSFVPNITFGPKFIKDIRSSSNLFFDTHLMIDNPEKYISDFADAGSDAITIHYEAAVHVHRAVQRIHETGKLAGVSVVPSTPVELLEDLLSELDMVLVMTVNPGFGGQSLIPFCIEKVRKLKAMCQRINPDCRIAVDGGINTSTIIPLKEAGIDIAVAGSAFFSAASPKAFISEICQA